MVSIRGHSLYDLIVDPSNRQRNGSRLYLFLWIIIYWKWEAQKHQRVKKILDLITVRALHYKETLGPLVVDVLSLVIKKRSVSNDDNLLEHNEIYCKLHIQNQVLINHSFLSRLHMRMFACKRVCRPLSEMASKIRQILVYFLQGNGYCKMLINDIAIITLKTSKFQNNCISKPTTLHKQLLLNVEVLYINTGLFFSRFFILSLQFPTRFLDIPSNVYLSS